jgi:hypothetical protein
MGVREQSDYQYYTQENVKSILKAPKTADFPSIRDWSFGKNPFYTAVQSYVDAQNSFGAEIRSEFYFVYQTGTDNLVYAIFDGEVIYNDGYVPTADLIKKLVTTTAPTKITKDNAETPKTNNTQSNQGQTSNTKPVQTASKPTFTGSMCHGININTGMPANNVSSFDISDNVMFAGQLTGVSGENNLIFRWTFPDGSTQDDMCYYLKNGETTNNGHYASNLGTGSGSVTVILESTGETLATYYYTITGETTEEEYYYEEEYNDPEMHDVNTELAEQEFLEGLPSLDDVEIETQGEYDLDGIATQLSDEEYERLQALAE